MQQHHRLKYKNIIILLLSIFFALILSRFEEFHSFLLNLGNFGYIGAFIAGMLFVSTFTVATGAVVLLVLAEKLSPVEEFLKKIGSEKKEPLEELKVTKEELVDEESKVIVMKF